ncbi:MAG: tetratricopeptide repeat protein [Roseobacter sp.]
MTRFFGHGTLVIVFMFAATLCFAQESKSPTEQLQRQAKQGEPIAQVELGLRYLEGEGVSQDFSIAAEWLDLAATQGNAQAQNLLGRLYSDGLGVPQNTEQALAFFEQAAKSEHPQYLTDLARILEQKEGTLERAALLYKTAADAGDPIAMVSFGVLLQSGRGIHKDFAAAFDYYQKAAALGNGRALNNLGLMYARGEGVSQDHEHAAELFDHATKLGVTQAFRNLGVLYENGFGVPLDEQKAVELYRLAGQGGAAPLPPAERYTYDKRLAPITISPETLSEIQGAALAGDPIAQFQLAWVLVQPTSPRFEDVVQAAQLFESAANAGYGPAMANIGMMYYRGEGVHQDYVLGHMWLSLANESRVDLDPNLKAEFAQLASAAQINESQSLIRQRLSLKHP